MKIPKDIKIVEEPIIVKGMMIHHGHFARKHSGYSAKAELDDKGISGISGHTHRFGVHSKKDYSGHKIWIENFCMCQIEDVEYIKGVANWQQGFTLIRFEGNKRYIEPIMIFNNTFVYGSKLYSSSSVKKIN